MQRRSNPNLPRWYKIPQPDKQTKQRNTKRAHYSHPETSAGLVSRQSTLLRADKRLKGYVQARPQQVVRIGKLYGDLGRLGCRVELVSSGDETTFVRIFVAGRQDQLELTLLGGLLEGLESAALKIHGSRRLADHIDRIQLNNSGE